MRRYVLVSFLISIAAALACSVFPAVPEPPRVTAQPTSSPVQIVAAVGSPTPQENVVVSNTPTAILKPAKILQEITATQQSLIASATPLPTAIMQMIVPSKTPKSAVPGITPTPIPLALFPDIVNSTTDAIYQPFEHGFMLWRSDFNCVYAIRNDEPNDNDAIIPNGVFDSYGYCLTVAPLSDRTVSVNPPQGLFEPDGAIGKVWRYYSDLRNTIGYAAAPAQRYEAVIPATSHEPIDGSPFDIPQLSLPNGKMLVCGSRAATHGTCGLRDGY